jgi:cysteine desulfurase
VAGIAGFGAAAAAASKNLADESAILADRRDGLERRLKASKVPHTIFAEQAPRLPNTTLFAVPGVKAETAVIALDLAGVAVSSGAACSSGKVAPSHVLAAMGVEPELARGAIRVSLGPTTTEAEVESFQNAWNKVLTSLLKGARTIAA